MIQLMKLMQEKRQLGEMTYKYHFDDDDPPFAKDVDGVTDSESGSVTEAGTKTITVAYLLSRNVNRFIILMRVSMPFGSDY